MVKYKHDQPLCEWCAIDSSAHHSSAHYSSKPSDAIDFVMSPGYQNLIKERDKLRAQVEAAKALDKALSTPMPEDSRTLEKFWARIVEARERFRETLK